MPIASSLAMPHRTTDKGLALLHYSSLYQMFTQIDKSFTSSVTQLQCIRADLEHKQPNPKEGWGEKYPQTPLVHLGNK